MNEIVDLVRRLDVDIIALLLSIPRMHAFLGASQLLNNSVVPGGARNAVIVALLLFVAPLNLSFASHFDRSLAALAILVVKEYAIGFLLGWLVGWVFWSLQAAGSLIDTQRGTSIASSMDPLLGEEASSLGNLFSLAFVTYAFASPAMLYLLAALYKSFALWPIERMIPTPGPDFLVHFLSAFDFAMRTMFLLAGPMVAVMFLAEFALAMVSRFSPQVQVFILAMPIKSQLALMMLIFYGSIMIQYAGKMVYASSDNLDAFYRTLTDGALKKPERPR